MYIKTRADYERMSLFPLLGRWGPAHIRLSTHPRLHLLKQLLKCLAVWFLVLRKSIKRKKYVVKRIELVHLEASYERQS